ncbi:MAG: Clp protease ClpP [Bacteroidales bacterium]|nr:Clp protease ClpP [Bacteroidales bacterium]
MLIKKISNRHVEVKMYGNIGGWFVDGFNFTNLLDSFEEDGYEEVTFRMHSYGGTVFEGDVIGGAFARSKMKINIIIDGIAASMACMILPYVPTENVSIAANGFGMVHRPEGGRGGNASQHLQTAKLLLDIEGNFIKTLSERTGKAAEEVKKFFDGSDHWLNADEMIEWKLAGKKINAVAPIRKLDKESLQKMSEENAYGHFAAKLEPKSNFQNTSKMKKELINAFNLEGLTEESSDTAVIQALQNKFKTTEDRLKALEKASTEKKEAEIKARLDKAEKDGKITAETRDKYKSIGDKNGVDVLDTVLQSIGDPKQTTPISTKIEGGKGDTPKAGDKNWKWYQENDPRALEQMPESDPDKFKALYKAEFGVEPEL